MESFSYEVYCMNDHTRRQEGQALSRKSSWLRAAVFFGLGALLTILLLLPGCGSESQPGGTVAGKKDKTMKPQAPIPLAMEGGMTPGEAGKSGQVNKAPDSRPRIGTIGGMTQEELEAKAAESMAQMKKAQANNPPVIMGGMTQEQLEAKAQESAAQMKKVQKSNPGVIMGGMTQEQLEAKAAESMRQLESKRGGEIFPGITQQEAEEVAARGPRRAPSPQEMFPGATQEQLDAVRQ
jgi:hypothetical protein